MASHSTNLPTRTVTNTTDGEDAIPDEDNTEVTRLFNERLQAWKHAVGYLEDYVQATEKMQHAHGKEYEKVVKTVSHPLKEGHHFQQSLGGVAGMFDNIRSNTEGISNAHYETARTLKGSVLPIFERLHTEIKNKTKELTKGAGKGSKIVEKARQTTQRHIELFGQHTATFDSAGGNVKATDDPYVLQRGVYHRLNRQVIEENSNRQDLLSVQEHFSQFEAHIIQTIQSGMGQFNQVVTNQGEQQRTMYGDIASTTHKMQSNFEWNGFVHRNNQVLIDRSAPQRSVSNISFPNQDHKATKPLIAGSLERKGTMLKSYSNSYYVVTPSKYLHEFKTDDDFAKDPTPENSLYLPDCIIGGVDGVKFNVKGKDASKSSIGSKLSRSHEFAFKAHTPQDAQMWHDVISSVAGQTSNEMPETTAPSSPVEGKGASANFAPESGYVSGPTGTTNAEKYAAGASSGVATADRV